MIFKGMFRLPKNKKFGYQPRYYDPAKEELEYRIARAKQEANGIEVEDYIPMRHGDLRKNSRLLGTDRKSSTKRTIIIMIILVMLAYWLIYS